MDVEERIKNAKTKRLARLELNSKGITILPDNIGLLEDLMFLDLSQNSISELPASFSKLKNLRTLHLRKNSFETFPEVLLELSNLKHLCLSDNQLSVLPDRINQLINIEELLLSDNIIIHIPESIKDLKKLRHLCLKRNHINEVPNNFHEFSHIIEFHLQDNAITHIPLDLQNASIFNQLSVDGNPLIEPPRELLSKGTGALLQYLIEKEKGRVFRVPMDHSLRTALKQYLVYFNDFVLATKGIVIGFEVKNYEEGIELSINTTSDDELDKVQKYLKEYMNFTRTNIDNLNPVFANEVNSIQKDLIIVDLRHQVRNLQTQLEVRSVEANMYKEQSQKMYNLLELERKLPQPINVQNQIQTIAQASSSSQNMIDITHEVPTLLAELSEFKKLLREELGTEETVNQLELVDADILEIDDCETDAAKISKTPFRRLKRILDEINEEDSTLGKTVKAAGKTLEAAKKLGRTYNKFAQWLGIPIIPEVFVSE